MLFDEGLVRALTILLLALFFARGTGVWAVVEALSGQECEACENCPGANDGACAPECELCACCGSARAVEPPLTIVAPEPGGGRHGVPFAPSALPQLEPKEILHVPRPLPLV
ncbi:MAG: hypothetical protein IT384_09495 [Deltaproteobacteria bacterium]|nr:hypothetical protein [Deltaproteobacteria bacterium]